MRRLRHLFVAGVILVLVAGGSSPAESQAPPGDPPSRFEVSASASAVLAGVSVPAVFPLGVDLGAMVSSVRASATPFVVAQASLVYAPLLVTAVGPTPLFCAANFPSDETEASCGGPTQGAEPVAASAASGHASASGETYESDGQLSGGASTRAAGLGTGAGAPVPMSIGSVATSAASAPDGDKIVAGASSAVSDVDIAGVLRIESIRSSVSGVVSGRADGAAVEHALDVTGATVAGQRVRITPDGVEAAGESFSGFPLGDVQSTVNEALAAAGIEVRLVPPDPPAASEDGRTVSATSGGVGFSFREASGTNVNLLFGQSALDMFGTTIDSDSSAFGGDVGGDDVPPDVPPDVAPEVANDVAARPPAPTADADRVVTAPPAPTPGAGADPPSRSVRTPMVAAAPASSRPWSLPYLPFALLVVSLPVLSLARRLPLTGSTS